MAVQIQDGHLHLYILAVVATVADKCFASVLEMGAGRHPSSDVAIEADKHPSSDTGGR